MDAEISGVERLFWAVAESALGGKPRFPATACLEWLCSFAGHAGGCAQGDSSHGEACGPPQRPDALTTHFPLPARHPEILPAFLSK